MRKENKKFHVRVSQRRLTNAMEKFEQTLTTKNVTKSKNIGFRINKSIIHTYSQEKIGFNYFYCKRKVLEDGVTTVPLDIVVSPWEEKVLLVDDIHNPLSNLYQCKLTYDGFSFCSSEHLYFYLISTDAKKYDLCNRILDEMDPFDLEILMEEFNKSHQKEDDRERIMRFAILHKFTQNQEFRKKLRECSNSYIAYKQSSLSKEDISFWGVTTSSSLVLVLSPSSLSGNNLLGKILMDYSKKNRLYNVIFFSCNKTLKYEIRNFIGYIVYTIILLVI